MLVRPARKRSELFPVTEDGGRVRQRCRARLRPIFLVGLAVLVVSRCNPLVW